MDLVINLLQILLKKLEEDVCNVRKALDIDLNYNEVDTCAGECTKL